MKITANAGPEKTPAITRPTAKEKIWKIKAIVFDVGGVLRDSSETFYFVFGKVFGEFGISYAFDSIDVWHLRGFLGLNSRRMVLDALVCMSRSGENLSEIMKLPDAENRIAEIIKKNAHAGDAELIEKMARRYIYWFYENTESCKYTKLMPHVKEPLKALSKKYALSVLTDSRLSLTEKWLEETGIGKYFKCIIGEEQLKRKKPDPEGLILTAEKLGLNPKELVYAGDCADDIAAAKNAGCKSAAVLTGMGLRRALEKERPDFVFEDLRKLSGAFLKS